MGTLSSVRQLVALGLALLLIPLQLPARDKKKQPTQPTAISAGLKLYILRGGDGVNYIPDHKNTPLVVEVRNENDVPVEGARVDFQLPESGPGGEFPGGKHILTVLTDPAGQVQADFTVNTPGVFSILITAKIDTRMGSVTLRQTNSTKLAERGTISKDHKWYKDGRVLLVIGAVAAGGIVAAVLLTRSSSANTPATSVVLTTGSPTFGAPH